MRVSRHHIQGMRTAGRETTATVYNTALLQLERCLRKNNLSFKDVTYSNLRTFRNLKESDGAANSTVHNYLCSIRTLVNEAINQGYMNQVDYPFKKGLFPKVEATRKQALSRDQIRELETLDLSGKLPQNGEGFSPNRTLRSNIISQVFVCEDKELIYYRTKEV
ncbi:phage integrase SAM-like domain-containing protein [Phaeocystidibacter luteus]|uniref:phage integrase SAM-like domain-containing protein n=1 Tax=Phaeocystidibacter luteus TaxID=911197 RepID=UPI001CB8D366